MAEHQVDPLEEGIRALLRANLPRVADKLEVLLRNCIRIETAPASNLALGVSRFGGEPDLPPGLIWPEKDGKPLPFLAQIKMEEVAPYDTENLVPKSGILYFFYDTDEQPWGYAPEDKGKSRVLFYDGPVQQLTRSSTPEAIKYGATFQACALTFSRQLTLPPFGLPEIEQLQLTSNPPKWIIDKESGQIVSITPNEGPDLPNKEWENYQDLLNWIEDTLGSASHRLLGYPSEIQGDMQSECQLVSNGINTGGPEGYQDARVDELLKGATSWRLLLQIDSDDHPGWMWGDAGRIYYWIRQEDLAQRNFDDIWLILQCY